MRKNNKALTSKMESEKDGTQSFLEIFHQYNEKVFNFIFRITQNYHAAEDLTQEVFLKVYQKGLNPSGHPNFGGWIFRVARNLCLNALRDNRTKISLENVIRDKSQEAATGPTDPYHDLTAQETKELVRKTLRDLNDDQREVLILREYHNFSYGEIAEITQSSVSAVKSLLFRARESLRKKLNTTRR